MHVLVVGGGIGGLSLAWALSRSGHEVSVFEADGLPGAAGLSMARARSDHALIPGHPELADQAVAARAAWDRLFADLDADFSVTTGALAIDRGGDLAGVPEAAKQAGRELVRLSPGAAATRWPHLAIPEDATLLYDPAGRVLRAGVIVEHLAHHLGRGPVRMRGRVRVESVDAARGSVILDKRHGLSNREVQGDAVVVAAGAATPRLVPELADRLTRHRRVTVTVEPGDGLAASWAALPVTLDPGLPARPYLRPALAPAGGEPGRNVRVPLTLGLDGPAAAGPDAPAADKDEAMAIRAHVAGLMSELTQGWIDAAPTAIYLRSQDGAAAHSLGPAGLALTPLDPAGFRLAPLVGEAVARWLTGAGAWADIPKLDAARGPPLS